MDFARRPHCKNIHSEAADIGKWMNTETINSRGVNEAAQTRHPETTGEDSHGLGKGGRGTTKKLRQSLEVNEALDLA